MKNFFIIPLVFSGLLVFSACSSGPNVLIGGEKIRVEIADSMEEQRTGLMFREELCENCGMLFVYKKDQPQSFWMKNTLIPLDIIFINSNLEIVDIHYAVPCKSDPCVNYKSAEDAMYVLEVHGGKFPEGIIGENVEINID